jgi:4-hydroxy-4-methyl-2-oxoglutarate aldolase
MQTKIKRTTLERLRDFDTALLANTIGYIDPTPPFHYYMGSSIRSMTPEIGPTVGIAVTCEMDTSTPTGKPDLAGYWQQLNEMSRLDLPFVWVVKCVGSRPDHECVIGDGMAKALFAVGCVGVVTNGGVRDVSGLRTVPMAAYARGTTIHHAALRVVRRDRPIRIGGITVSSGDVIHANAEGVIRIPLGCLSPLADRAVEMRAFEHAAHQILRRTDFSQGEKQRLVGEALVSYGFSASKKSRTAHRRAPSVSP